MGVVRRVRTQLPDWPWRELIGGIVAVIFVLILSLISAHALILAGTWPLWHPY
ncbi:hypothetical protein [Gluconobacter morbifer]|uniref:Uncharacterized protein n=1 Tax=Gluconobacter morbifer G707 TaxID=1088869 RepID=G6XMU5_9PROT|nr:hypothetical protein [Gluconobacter morbifer]EHH66921.1 hypothetical protein GMO_28130 [Gluconobacter morbifer G707]